MNERRRGRKERQGSHEERWWRVNKRGDVRKLIYRHIEHRGSRAQSQTLVFESPLSPAFWRSAAPHNILAPETMG